MTDLPDNRLLVWLWEQQVHELVTKDEVVFAKMRTFAQRKADADGAVLSDADPLLMPQTDDEAALRLRTLRWHGVLPQPGQS